MNGKKQKKNYLDLIPERAEGLSWEKGEDNIIVLQTENTGLFNREQSLCTRGL